ncbi:hypothetical protein D3C86_1735310 [compost metagenome]
MTRQRPGVFQVRARADHMDVRPCHVARAPVVARAPRQEARRKSRADRHGAQRGAGQAGLRAEHGLQLRKRQQRKRTDAVPLIHKLLQQAEPADLLGRVQPLAAWRTGRRGQLIAPLPDAQGFHGQAGQLGGDPRAVGRG